MKKCILLLLLCVTLVGCGKTEEQRYKPENKTLVLEKDFTLLVDDMLETLKMNNVNIKSELRNYVNIKEIEEEIIKKIQELDYYVISENIMSNGNEAVLVISIKMKNIFGFIQSLNATSLLVGEQEEKLDVNYLINDVSISEVVTSVYLEKDNDKWKIVDSNINNDFFNCITGNLYQHLYQ